MWKVWYGAEGSCHRQSGLWSAKGIANGGMLKGRVTRMIGFPDSVSRRVLRRHRGRSGKTKDVYGLFAYLRQACSAVNQVCDACVGEQGEGLLFAYM